MRNDRLKTVLFLGDLQAIDRRHGRRAVTGAGGRFGGHCRITASPVFAALRAGGCRLGIRPRLRGRQRVSAAFESHRPEAGACRDAPLALPRCAPHRARCRRAALLGCGSVRVATAFLRGRFEMDPSCRMRRIATRALAAVHRLPEAQHRVGRGRLDLIERPAEARVQLGWRGVRRSARRSAGSPQPGQFLGSVGSRERIGISLPTEEATARLENIPILDARVRNGILDARVRNGVLDARVHDVAIATWPPLPPPRLPGTTAAICSHPTLLATHTTMPTRGFAPRAATTPPRKLSKQPLIHACHTAGKRRVTSWLTLRSPPLRHPI
mmetsp:Transcript_26728/g.60438  ORF Transcript_26728/g.60438 Transcript_26728/m.60438 type:complete len:326 (+) Transcript_26728:303-1280(+)